MSQPAQPVVQPKPQLDIVYIAYRDTQTGMRPASSKGRLTLYPTFALARANAGALGVPAAVAEERVCEIAESFGLKVTTIPVERELGTVFTRVTVEVGEGI